MRGVYERHLEMRQNAAAQLQRVTGGDAALLRLDAREAPEVWSPSEPGTPLVALSAQSIDAALELQQLRLPTAGRLARKVIESIAASPCATTVDLLPSVILAEIAYEQGNLVEAEAAVRAILPRVRSAGTAEIAIRAYGTLALAAEGLGRTEFAAAMLREGDALGDERQWPRLSAACLAARVDLLARLGRRLEARTAFERLSSLCEPAANGKIDTAIGIYLALARCRMASLGKAPFDEVTTIRALMATAVATGNLLGSIKLAVRLVGALERAGDRTEAVKILSQVAAIGCDVGLFQTFLEGDAEFRSVLQAVQPTLVLPHLKAFAAELLEHWPEIAPPDRVNRGERRSEGMLTPRECGVLHLMSLGDSNKRIARRLGIAPETVKSHVKNIFLRLGSSTRAEAVSRAASLGMV